MPGLVSGLSTADARRLMVTPGATLAQAPPPPRAAAGDAEFDFADVFGPISSDAGSAAGGDDAEGSVAHPGAARGDDAGDEGVRLADWAPVGSIRDGTVPFVICHRAHSMVGPALTPRHSFSRKFAEDAQFGAAGAGSALSGLANARTPSEADLCAALEREMGLASACQITQPAGEALPHAPGSASSGSDDEGAQLQSGEGSGRVADESVAAQQLARVGPDSFELLRVVGQGAFGKVFQVQHKESGEILAMKVMRKDRILERNQGDYMQAERDILTRVTHPFIVQLQYSFQTKSKLYLLLDFINGGHLFFQLYRQGTFSEDLARIYAAELVLAVGHLHSMGIMHRDLKPENILLDCDGHIKLTDFGLAKEFSASDKSNSLCGTMEYMAPEIIQAQGHGPAADFWSIGILIFEMLTGQPPFSCNNRQKLQQRIIKDKIKFPSFLTSEAHSLLKGLLQKDPNKRLGSGPGGVDEVKRHKWFKVIHWEKLARREIQPKFRPTVNGKHCTANFDEMWTRLPAQDSPACTPPTLDTSLFRNYTYVAPHQKLPTVESDSDGEAPSTSDGSQYDSESDD